MPDQVTLTGRVTRGVVAAGSKSEGGALLLESDAGTHLVRRRGAPSWGDDDAELAALEGRNVELSGSIVAGTLLVDSWRIL